MKLEVLRRYCERHNIKVKNKRNRVQLEAAITRFVASTKTVEPGELGCFGYWSGIDPTCKDCFHKKACYTASFGLEPPKEKLRPNPTAADIEREEKRQEREHKRQERERKRR